MLTTIQLETEIGRVLPLLKDDEQFREAVGELMFASVQHVAIASILEEAGCDFPVTMLDPMSQAASRLTGFGDPGYLDTSSVEPVFGKPVAEALASLIRAGKDFADGCFAFDEEKGWVMDDSSDGEIKLLVKFANDAEEGFSALLTAATSFTEAFAWQSQETNE